MPRSIYVIGHKNSDLDSVASAYAYARLLRLQGEEQAIQARNGNLKPEVRFVLERYQVEPPEALDDVYLQVRDVMRRGVISAYLDQTLLEAGQLLQEHNRRAMPVVDAENKVHGIIAVEDFAKLFFNDLDPQAVNRVPLQKDNLVRALKGRVLVEGRRKLGNRVLVGAMQADTMVDYIEPGCLVVLGDREDAQLAAIEHGAAALVITGDLLISERTLAAARKNGVLVVSTGHHTFRAVRRVTLSTSKEHIRNREFDFSPPEDQMSEVHITLARRRSLHFAHLVFRVAEIKLGIHDMFCADAQVYQAYGRKRVVPGADDQYDVCAGSREGALRYQQVAGDDQGGCSVLYSGQVGCFGVSQHQRAARLDIIDHRLCLHRSN